MMTTQVMKVSFYGKGESLNTVVDDQYIVDVLLHIKKRSKNEEPQPQALEEEGDMEVIPMTLDCIQEVSSVTLHLPNDLIRLENRMIVKETIKEVCLTHCVGKIGNGDV